MSNATYIDNKNGTIIKVLDNGERFAYDFLVGCNIPEKDLMVDYCYNQFDETLTDILSKNDIPTDSFCSGTCAAMILAISRGDSSIKPEAVAIWDNVKDINGKSTRNWAVWETGEGLIDWEQEKDIKKDGGQIYDNRDNNHDAVDGSRITTDEEYLKNIKVYLSEGLPVIIEVYNHYVVIVGVESDVKLDEAKFEDLVIFDPGRSDEYKITTLGKSAKNYKNISYRLLTPFPVVKKSDLNNNKEFYPNTCYSDPLDDEWAFVADENGNKTHDPYYLAPVRKYDSGEAESIIPAKQGRPLKEAIKAVNCSFMPEDEKEKLKDQLIKLFTGEDFNAVYESLAVTENGEYVPEEGVTAFKKVSVNVAADVKSKSITKNGTYSAADDGAEGFDIVDVNVKPYVKLKNIARNGTYSAADDGAEGFSVVNVNVVPYVKSKNITENGTYLAADDGAEGFGVVNVNVSDKYDEGYTDGIQDYKTVEDGGSVTTGDLCRALTLLAEIDNAKVDIPDAQRCIKIGITTVTPESRGGSINVALCDSNSNWVYTYFMSLGYGSDAYGKKAECIAVTHSESGLTMKFKCYGWSGTESVHDCIIPNQWMDYSEYAVSKNG